MKEWTMDDIWAFILRNDKTIKRVANIYKKEMAYSGQEIEDVIQIIYEELINAIPKYDELRSTERSYTVQIARRAIFRIRIAGKAAFRIPEDNLYFFSEMVDDYESVSFCDYFEDRRQSVEDVAVWNDALETELSRLTDPRDVLMIRAELEGLTNENLAEILQVSSTTIAKRRKELFAMLRDRLNDKKPLLFPKLGKLNRNNHVQNI